MKWFVLIIKLQIFKSIYAHADNLFFYFIFVLQLKQSLLKYLLQTTNKK